MNYDNNNVKELIKSFKEDEYFDFVNLHIHSKFSDGAGEFEDILNQARDFGFRKISICDHNTVAGHKHFRDKILLTGVEFDCWCGYVFMHLLAYGIDVENPILNKFMAKNKRETEMDIVRIFSHRNVKKLIDAIHQSGGIAVLAHPACCWALDLDKFVQKLISYGLDGIEVYYPYKRHRKIIKFHSEETVRAIADKYDLIKTGGTDCHTRNIL